MSTANPAAEFQSPWHDATFVPGSFVVRGPRAHENGVVDGCGARGDFLLGKEKARTSISDIQIEESEYAADYDSSYTCVFAV